MSEVQQEFARLRGVCTLADGNEKRMPPTQTHFESLMVSVEPHWVQLGLQLHLHLERHLLHLEVALQ